jgi:hypothetical protein
MASGSDCACGREIRHLKDRVRELKLDLERAKRDVEDGLARLNRRIAAIRSNVGDLYQRRPPPTLAMADTSSTHVDGPRGLRTAT